MYRQTGSLITSNAGLKEGAIRDVGTAKTNVMEVGAFGIGTSALTSDGLFPSSPADANDIVRSGFYKGAGQSGLNYAIGFAPLLHMVRDGGADGTGSVSQMQIDGSGIAFRYRNVNVWSTWGNVYSTKNTTKAADGTIKAASPVVTIFHDGRSETNDESEGCTVTRLGVGQYLIKNCMGLNADASWSGIDGGFDIPCDRHKRVRIWLDYKVNADGSILVKTYHCTYPESPAFAQNRIGYKDEDGVFTETVKDGELVDIPVDQYLLVRVEMPADSIWNQKQAATQAESEALHSQSQSQPQEYQPLAYPYEYLSKS